MSTNQGMMGAQHTFVNVGPAGGKTAAEKQLEDVGTEIIHEAVQQGHLSNQSAQKLYNYFRNNLGMISQNLAAKGFVSGNTANSDSLYSAVRQQLNNMLSNLTQSSSQDLSIPENKGKRKMTTSGERKYVILYRNEKVSGKNVFLGLGENAFYRLTNDLSQAALLSYKEACSVLAILCKNPILQTWRMEKKDVIMERRENFSITTKNIMVMDVPTLTNTPQNQSFPSNAAGPDSGLASALQNPQSTSMPSFYPSGQSFPAGETEEQTLRRLLQKATQEGNDSIPSEAEEEKEESKDDLTLEIDPNENSEVIVNNNSEDRTDLVHVLMRVIDHVREFGHVNLDIKTVDKFAECQEGEDETFEKNGDSEDSLLITVDLSASIHDICKRLAAVLRQEDPEAQLLLENTVGRETEQETIIGLFQAMKHWILNNDDRAMLELIKEYVVFFVKIRGYKNVVVNEVLEDLGLGDDVHISHEEVYVLWLRTKCHFIQNHSDMSQEQLVASLSYPARSTLSITDLAIKASARYDVWKQLKEDHVTTWSELYKSSGGNSHLSDLDLKDEWRRFQVMNHMK